MLLGCIADDFTGATDLANVLVRGGMRTVQCLGVPSGPVLDADVDAVVIALKSRTIAVGDAVRQSLAALDWLRAAGCRQFYFKYCSTFDSTDKGNIGPVTDALMEALGTGFTIACPAFPENGRTVYRGHLFVGDVLLSDSGMKDHPLTPMTDSNLVEALRRQTRRKVGLVSYDAVARGKTAIEAHFAASRGQGVQIVIVDAVFDADLEAIGAACADIPFITGSSGVAAAIPSNFRGRGLLGPPMGAVRMPRIAGFSAVLSGSCSAATNQQVAQWLRTRPGFRIDPRQIMDGVDVVAGALRWAKGRLPQGPLLFYATASPDEVKAVQAKFGADRSGALIEACLADIACGLAQEGVRRIVVAGGETSGAVMNALGVTALRIGPQIDPGVPWTVGSIGGEPMALALKSGNFGTVDFFAKALAMLDGR